MRTVAGVGGSQASTGGYFSALTATVGDMAESDGTEALLRNRAAGRAARQARVTPMEIIRQRAASEINTDTMMERLLNFQHQREEAGEYEEYVRDDASDIAVAYHSEGLLTRQEYEAIQKAIHLD